MISRHHSTGIYTGHVLALIIVCQMKERPDSKKDFAGAKVEIAAVGTASKN